MWWKQLKPIRLLTNDNVQGITQFLRKIQLLELKRTLTENSYNSLTCSWRNEGPLRLSALAKDKVRYTSHTQIKTVPYLFHILLWFSEKKFLNFSFSFFYFLKFVLTINKGTKWLLKLYHKSYALEMADRALLMDSQEGTQAGHLQCVTLTTARCTTASYWTPLSSCRMAELCSRYKR